MKYQHNGRNTMKQSEFNNVTSTEVVANKVKDRVEVEISKAEQTVLF